MPSEALILSPDRRVPAAPPAVRARMTALALRAGALAVFVVVFAVFSLTAPFFFTVGNIGNILTQSAILGALSFGMTIVLIAGGSDIVRGGIDLTVAANLGLSAATYAIAVSAGHPDLVAIALALGVGLAIGVVNAISVVWLRILPLLATLAVMNVCAGLELVLTQNTIVPASSPFVAWLGGTVLGLPALAFVLLAITLALVVIMQYSPLGLRFLAVGQFREAARVSGLRVERYVAASYVLSGLCASIGGIMAVSFLSGSTTGSAEWLLPAVLTGLLGAVFSRRLVPTIGGTFLATLFIGCLLNGFQLLNISSYWVSGVEGALILLVVAVTSTARREGI